VVDAVFAVPNLNQYLRKQMTDPNYTHIAVVLDRSGSMSSIVKDTEGGYNTFLADQKKAPGTATISLAQFDNVYESVHGPIDIQTANNLRLIPRGGTALLDAMGKAITETGEYLAALPESKRPGKVVFVTITDGGENSSNEWTRNQVFKLVTKQREKFAWEFVFLGANQDAIAVGTSLGVSAGSSINYQASRAGTQSVYAGLSSNITNTRATGQSINFDSNQREAANSK
jgi:uncharacterized protein YegL